MLRHGFRLVSAMCRLHFLLKFICWSRRNFCLVWVWFTTRTARLELFSWVVKPIKWFFGGIHEIYNTKLLNLKAVKNPVFRGICIFLWLFERDMRMRRHASLNMIMKHFQGVEFHVDEKGKYRWVIILFISLFLCKMVLELSRQGFMTFCSLSSQYCTKGNCTFIVFIILSFVILGDFVYFLGVITH